MGQLQPRDLPFFNLIVLANCVHEHDPVYSLLKRQCFWYSGSIYHIISASYDCESSTPFDINGEFDDILIPLNDYLLDLEGRWMRLKVGRLSSMVLEIIRPKFTESLKRERAEVSLF